MSRHETEEFGSLLVKKIAGELRSEEYQSLQSHLAQCANCVAQEQELTQMWQGLELLQVPDIPTELFKITEQKVLTRLKQERSPFPLLRKVPRAGFGSILLSAVAGLVMTGVSYFLIHNLANLGIHHHYVLISLFSLWWMLFGGSFWVVLKGNRKRSLSIDRIAASSLSITLLTLLIYFLAYEVDSIRSLAMSVIYAVAIVSNHLFGVGNAFITGWWIYCCVASFTSAFIFGLHKAPTIAKNIIVTSMVISLLLIPAIFVQGSSHSHGIGIVAMAALGTYVGSLLGISLGVFLRRKIFFQRI
jgi:hypothetical protein